MGFWRARPGNGKDRGGDSTKVKVLVTRDYLLFASERGGVSLVVLNRVERIELDAVDRRLRTHGGNTTLYIKKTEYPIYFYYQKPGEVKNAASDVTLYFPDRELRDQVAAYVKEGNGQ